MIHILGNIDHRRRYGKVVTKFVKTRFYQGATPTTSGTADSVRPALAQAQASSRPAAGSITCQAGGSLFLLLMVYTPPILLPQMSRIIVGGGVVMEDYWRHVYDDYKFRSPNQIPEARTRMRYM